MSFSERQTPGTKQFKEQIGDAPADQGIYFFWDEDGNCLYIGKATNMRKRLREHYRSYRQCEWMRDDMDYDDPEMAAYAIEQFADQLIHAHMDKVETVTTKLISGEGLVEQLEETFIRAILPAYNEDYNHIQTDDELKLACPECGNQLTFMKTAGESGGYVCKNFDCRHYWKLKKGDVVEVVSE